MDYLGTKPRFNSLSLMDLLRARDQFHPHLMHKANVVGTAIGRYLIRRDDPYPKRGDDESVVPIKRKAKKPRTLDNSEVRSYSWPCVLVFVADWREEQEFGSAGLATSDFVPKAIYLEDGRSVPICVVLAPPVETAPPPLDPAALQFPSLQISGGYPVIARRQHGMHIGSIGCLVTDGHTLYALTSRHVAGHAGEELSTVLDGKEVVIGRTSAKQLGRKPFEKMYDGWPGKSIAINLDVGLIELADERVWSPSIYGIGKLGPLADLSTYNITLDLIGCPVAAHGCASDRLEGRIAALFYRYQSVGGLEYVADFLIGAREDAGPLETQPGDSGTVWVLEETPDSIDRRPIAVQWGGAVFSRDGSRMPFALATNLSTVCRELQVDVVRSREVATFEYWGAVGHYTIGSFACELPKDQSLRDFFLANRSLISFDPQALTTHVDNLTEDKFVQLADVPDVVWKNPKTQSTPYGRKGPENPNHYVDLDFPDASGKTLDDLITNAASLKTATWVAYYKSIGWNHASQRGLLPFRVWQIYKKMVDFAAAADLPRFVAAAGILAHYVGDACQPLHGSYLTDGDPFRKPDGTKVAKALPYKTNYAHGVHSAYEKNMINAGLPDILTDLPKALKANHGMALVKGGPEAAFATVELMRRTRKKLEPKTIVAFYAPFSPSAKQAVAAKLWKEFKAETLAVLADGCKTLAMIWESAWVEGKGDHIPKASLKKMNATTLRKHYEDPTFLPSKALGDIDPFL